MREFISDDPYLSFDVGKPWTERGVWPCKWVACQGSGDSPFVTAYRRKFSLENNISLRIHVSADERYELFLDGERIGRGSERGDRNNWFYETYRLDLTGGEHVLVARVWSMGEAAPYAQMSVMPGFILACDDLYLDLLATGVSEWEAKPLLGYEITWPHFAFGTGGNIILNGEQFGWDFEKGEGNGWKPVVLLHHGNNGLIRNEVHPVHMMRPATLPAMLEKEVSFGAVRFAEHISTSDTTNIPVTSQNNDPSLQESLQIICNGGRITLPAGTQCRAIIDLGDYYCGYPEVMVSGGKSALIRINWAEALYQQVERWSKGNRDDIEGKYFGGLGDTFLPDGGHNRRFDTLWWQAGRYVEIYLKTEKEPLTIESLKLRETHYPMYMESSFKASDERYQSFIPIGFRTLQMCSHETYMDCPYYEQLMYVGDTRLEALVTYVSTIDDRLPRKALQTFDASRLLNGLTQSRYPSRARQVIPPFSLWWVGMVYDYAVWRDDLPFVKSLLPGVRGVLDCFQSFLNEDGLVEAPNGWNYVDWVPGWGWGIPPDGEFGVNAIINWHYVYALKIAAKLEEYTGELELAARDRRMASELAQRITAAFWDSRRGMYADDLAFKHFSEHAQCLAILSDEPGMDRIEKMERNLLEADDLARTTIYFSHYLFETFALLERIPALMKRLEFWFDLEGQGFKTTLESPEPSRSDCHAWGAHPIYHYFASVLGIRPAGMGFRSVTIKPQLGNLEHAEGKVVHPMGDIETRFYNRSGEINGEIVLPVGLKGTFINGSRNITLQSGRQRV